MLSGKVQVDGFVVQDPAVRVEPAEVQIEVDGAPLPAAEALRYYALNKPHGVVSTARDDHGRRSVVEFLPEDAGRCVPVGRLDRDSEGLLLLSNDGPLIDGLLHPRHELQRTYLSSCLVGPTTRRWTGCLRECRPRMGCCVGSRGARSVPGARCGRVRPRGCG